MRAASSLPLVGGWLVALGSFSVVCTTLFYALSPPLAVAPVVTATSGALAAAAAGGDTMRLAGTCGVFGNLVMAIGTMLLAIDRATKGRAYDATGWIAIFVSIAVFEIVDCLTGFVLSPAAKSGSTSTFEAFRSIFAIFFLVGTACFGAGSILVFFDQKSGMLARWLSRFGSLNGLICVVSVAMTFAGWPLSRLVGASVGTGAVLFVFVGVVIARGGMNPDGVSYRSSAA